MTRVHVGHCTPIVQDMQRDSMGEHQAAEVAVSAEVAEVAEVAKAAEVAKVAEVAEAAEVAKVAEGAEAAKVAEVAEAAAEVATGDGQCTRGAEALLSAQVHVCSLIDEEHAIITTVHCSASPRHVVTC